MKNALETKPSTNEKRAPSSVSVRAAQKKELPEKKSKVGDKVVHSIAGVDVEMTLVRVPAKQVDRKTMVMIENERDQELLDEHSLAHLIPSFKEHKVNQVPAFARDNCGIIEVADGSCRRKTAILTASDYLAWVGPLSDDQMRYLSDIGNEYRPISPYERGLSYLRQYKKLGSYDKVGELYAVSRKIVTRCANTARLPKTFVKCFATPNELTARKGDELYIRFNKLDENKQEEVINFFENWMLPEKGKHSTEEIIELFNTKCGKKEKPEAPKPKELAMGASVIVKNGNATFNIPNASDEVIEAIEMIVNGLKCK